LLQVYIRPSINDAPAQLAGVSIEYGPLQGGDAGRDPRNRSQFFGIHDSLMKVSAVTDHRAVIVRDVA
jgi:hypothetical protein